MSMFKDAVLSDVRNVFINVDEFAETHELNGFDVRCIIDIDETASYSNSAGNTVEGVFKNTVKVYLKAGELPERPVEGELLRIDDSLHIVASVTDEMGIWCITAMENQQ